MIRGAVDSRLLEAVCDAVEEAVVATDRDGKVLFANAQACALSGWRVEELLGKPVAATLCRPFRERGRSLVSAVAGAAKNGSRGLLIEGVFGRRSGDRFPVECSVSALRMEGGPDGAVLVFTDISEKVRLREQYLRAQRMEALTGAAVPSERPAGLLERRPVEPKDVEWLTQGMRNVGFLSTLGRAQLGKVLTCMSLLRYDHSSPIIREGDRGDALYLIRSGSVSVTKAGWLEAVAVLREGEFVGEMSLLFDGPRLATVTALEVTEVYRLSAEDFKSILGRIPELVQTLKRLADARLRQLARS
ncbi:MAG: cyclic nucleotide-binding domain-containing protein [Elusimicrobia bacterium]|nr:cyclic nucleotide-binding domain-containing protein [Elusimicrobiota bacterium]